MARDESALLPAFLRMKLDRDPWAKETRAGVHRPDVSSLHPQIFRALLAAGHHDVVGHLGSFGQRRKSRFLERGDMDEHVLVATAIGLDETVTLGRIEPLHCAAWHV